MPDFDLLTREDYADIEREVRERGSLPALRMAVKKLQGYALRDILPQWGIAVPAVDAQKTEQRHALPEGRQA